MQQIIATRVLAAGTYSTNPTEGSGVDIRDYVGRCTAILDVGPSHAGVTPTAAVRLESAGTVAGVYAGVANSGTFPTASFSGTTVSLDFDAGQYNRYMRAFVSLGGTSPKAERQ